MAKYHVDPAGNPGVCRATKRCPFGDLKKDHFSSQEAARKSYELENTYGELTFDEEFKETLYEIGPRQLPNRAWASLRRSLDDNRFSEHEVAIALAGASEEWDKLSKLTSKSPYEWGDEEHEAATKLSAVAKLVAEVSKMSTTIQDRRLAAIEREFGVS